jgi:hypothetical protein
VPLAELRGRLIEMVRDQQKEFGLLVRKMDFPRQDRWTILRRLGQRTARREAGAGRFHCRWGFTGSTPDGREELVRGLRFRG